jgi:hypothetical protein
VEFFRGARPSQAAKSRPFRKGLRRRRERFEGDRADRTDAGNGAPCRPCAHGPASSIQLGDSQIKDGDVVQEHAAELDDLWWQAATILLECRCEPANVRPALRRDHPMLGEMAAYRIELVSFGEPGGRGS